MEQGNFLLQQEIEKNIPKFLKAINGDYMIPDSENMEFRGDEEVIAEYSFCFHDTSESEAQSFVKYIIHETEYKFNKESYKMEAQESM